MENKKTFGSYVKTKRVEANLTQKDFADKLYVTESAVSKWERGLSYPDITLIIEICRILNVTEHELLTASEDIKTRNQERLAKRYLSLIKKIKVAQIILYAIPIITCFIVNLAVSGKLSWFFIVLTAEAVAASLTLLPVLTEKKRGLVTLAGFTASLVLLLAVCRVYTGGDWFIITVVSVLFGLSAVFMPFVIRTVPLPQPFCGHKALITLAVNTPLLFVLLFTADIYTAGESWFLSAACPLTAFWLVLPWGYTAIIRYAKINGMFKTAGCLTLTNALFYFMRGFTDMVMKEQYKFGISFDFGNWNDYQAVNGNIDAIIFFAVFGLTVVFAVAGVMYEIKLRKPKN